MGVITDSNAYGFYLSNSFIGTWSTTTIVSPPLFVAGGADHFSVICDGSAYGFYQNSSQIGTWTSTSTSGSPAGATTGSN